MGACSCLTWSHENTLSGKRTFQALWLPRVVRNVVCGFWIFTINRKESALKQLVPWLLEGQTYICMLEMSPVKFQLSLFPYYFFKDAEHHSYSCLLLRSANRSLHKVSFTHMAAWSLHFFFGTCFCSTTFPSTWYQNKDHQQHHCTGCFSWHFWHHQNRKSWEPFVQFCQFKKLGKGSKQKPEP